MPASQCSALAIKCTRMLVKCLLVHWDDRECVSEQLPKGYDSATVFSKTR